MMQMQMDETAEIEIPRCQTFAADGQGWVEQCDSDGVIALRDGRFLCAADYRIMADHTIFDEATGRYREAV